MTANITGSSAATSADLLTDLKSGYLLGANPRKQFLAQFLGVWTGTLVATWGYYQLVPTPAAIGGDKFPAPAAQSGGRWRRSWPAASGPAPVRRHRHAPRRHPGRGARRAREDPEARGEEVNPVARRLRDGLHLPGLHRHGLLPRRPHGLGLQKRSPKAADVFTIPVASGFIAGETLMGVAITFLQVRGLL